MSTEQPALSMTLPSETLQQIVSTAVSAQIAAALGAEPGQVVNEIVRQALMKRVVVGSGENPKGFSREKTYTWLEHKVAEALREETLAQLSAWVEENRETLARTIRKQLDEGEGLALAEAAANGLVGCLGSSSAWRMQVSLTRTED